MYIQVFAGALVDDSVADLETGLFRHGRQTPIQARILSVRARKCLAAASVHTWEQIRELGKFNALRIHGFGRTSLREVRRAAKDNGFDLGPSWD